MFVVYCSLHDGHASFQKKFQLSNLLYGYMWISAMQEEGHFTSLTHIAATKIDLGWCLHHTDHCAKVKLLYHLKQICMCLSNDIGSDCCLVSHTII